MTLLIKILRHWWYQSPTCSWSWSKKNYCQIVTSEVDHLILIVRKKIILVWLSRAMSKIKEFFFAIFKWWLIELNFLAEWQRAIGIKVRAMQLRKCFHFKCLMSLLVKIDNMFLLKSTQHARIILAHRSNNLESNHLIFALYMISSLLMRDSCVLASLKDCSIEVTFLKFKLIAAFRISFSS